MTRNMNYTFDNAASFHNNQQLKLFWQDNYCNKILKIINRVTKF